MVTFDILAKRLAPYYSYFQVARRLLFTGHSHQAWPDAAFEGQKEAFTWAANQLDNKWVTAFKKTDKLRNYLRNYYQDDNGYYSFAPSTHELLIRLLSALNIDKTKTIITTDGEFYTVDRQLRRLEEEGIQIIRVPHTSPSNIVTHIQQAIQPNTAAVICSHVFYQSALVHTTLYDLAKITEKAGIPMIIDDYHGTHVIPLRMKELSECFVLGGGYKYLQWGEGNCFLRFPKTCQLRPVNTGWFAAYNYLESNHHAIGEEVTYDAKDMRFSGSTYDPTSRFRAAKVVDFFKQQQLTSSKLHKQYREQVSFMQESFLALDCPPAYIKLLDDVPIKQRGGFLALQSPNATLLSEELHKAGVRTDTRKDVIRFGAAPYLQKQQIQDAFLILKKVVQQLTK